MPLSRHLLTIDSLAGLSAGAFTLSLSPWLAELYGIPRPMIMVMGTANIAYGTYSGLLSRRDVRPYALIMLLIVANATWAILCFAAAGVLAGTASALGIAQLIGEGLFVGGLAGMEWRARGELQRRA